MKSLKKNAAFNIIYRGISVLFPLITSVYVARVLSAEGIGKVASAQNIVTYFTSFASLGIPTYGVKMISGYMGNRRKMSIGCSELLTINIISSALATIIFYTMVVLFPVFSDKRELYMIVGILIPFNAANVDWFYQGIEEYGYIAKRSLVVKTICLLLTIICVKEKSDVVMYAVVLTLGTTLNYIFNIIHLHKYVDFVYKNVELKKHLYSVFILFATSIFIEIYTLADTTMLTFICGDTEVGYYYTAMRIIAVIRMLFVAVVAVLYPRLSYYYSNGRKTEFQDLLDKGFNVLLLCTIPIVVGLTIMADNVVLVMFGEAFQASVLSTRILAVSIFTVAFSNFIGSQIFVIVGKEKLMFYSTIIGACANVILNFVLIFHFQHYGVSFASAFTELLVTVYQWIVLVKKEKIIPRLYDLKSIMQSTFVMAIIVLVLKIVIHENRVLELILCVGAGGISFIVMSLVTGNTIILETTKSILGKVRKNK